MLRSWTSRRAAPPKGPSAAQRCNDDALAEVFLHSDTVTLASAAQVCRAWLPAASRALYHDIHLATRHPSASKLALSLTTHSYLRSLVRHVTINRTDLVPWDPSYTDWLALLPANSLQSITLKGNIPRRVEIHTILEFPAIQTTSRIIAPCMLSFRSVTALLNMVHLESLALIMEYNMPFPEQGISLPKLRRLSISAKRYSTLFEQILRGLDSPLERFESDIHDLEEDDIASLQRGLERYAPSLKHLSFIGHPQDCFTITPFMDDYILSFPALRILQCSFPAFTPLLLSRLPQSLEFLILRTSPAHSLRAGCAAALQQHRNRLPALSQVTILVSDLEYGRVQRDLLAKVCRREGITFQVIVQVEVRDTDMYSAFSL